MLINHVPMCVVNPYGWTHSLKMHLGLRIRSKLIFVSIIPMYKNIRELHVNGLETMHSGIDSVTMK